MSKIKVIYYAALREKAGCSEEELECDVETGRQLYTRLQAKYGFDLESQQVRVAINDCFSSMDQTLVQNDRVVFIPPVAGG